MVLDGLYEWNSFLWIAGTVTVLLVAVASVLFSLLYLLFFNPKLTTAGVWIWRSIMSIAGLSVIASIGVFFRATDWWQLPETAYWWYPTLRMIVYGCIAYAFGGLVVVLVLRRFFPHKLRTAPNDGLHPRDPRDLFNRGS